MRVSEWMTAAPITVAPSTSVSEARELMRRRQIRHLLVTEGERLLGIITDRDIRLTLASPATSLSIWELHYLLARLTVGEAMTKTVVTVEPGQPVEEAARLMLERRIGALPVVEDRQVVGILTETDVLRAFVLSQSATAAHA